MTEISRQDDQVVITPQQDIVASVAADLRLMLKEQIDQGCRELVLDLRQVEMIDSTGIGLLIAAHNSLNKSGGKLKAINLSQDLQGLFKNMRLDQHFTVQGA